MSLIYEVNRKGKVKMLRNIQKTIILIFLVIGILTIGIVGYINYIGVQEIQESFSERNVLLDEYENQIKIVTICAILIFASMSIVIRNFCYKKDNFTNNKINK